MHTREANRTAVSAYFLVALFFATLGLFAQASAEQKSPDANAYRLEIEVVRNGELLAKPKMTIFYGKPAQITLGDRAKTDGNIRLQFIAEPGKTTANGTQTVLVRAIFLEQIAGAWVIAGEPSILAANGRLASLEVAGPTGNYAISVKATSEFNVRATSVDPKQCAALDAPIQTLGGMCPNCPALPCDQCPNCCEAPCGDGSGRTLSCCGAIECCDGVCGACCSPPL